MKLLKNMVVGRVVGWLRKGFADAIHFIGAAMIRFHEMGK